MDYNKYQKAINLIEKNDLRIVKEPTFDAQSGWHGEHYFVYDGDTKIVDLSVNGFCFREDNFDNSIEKIERYLLLKKIDNFKAFKVWVEERAIDWPQNVR